MKDTLYTDKQNNVIPMKIVSSTSEMSEADVWPHSPCVRVRQSHSVAGAGDKSRSS